MNREFPENSFTELTDKLNLLADIQNKFDIYQNENFVKRSPEFFCLELNGESGELANIEKKVWKGREIPPEKFQDEAADVFIALINYCNARSIDLSDAIRTKLKKIESIRRELAEKGKQY